MGEGLKIFKKPSEPHKNQITLKTFPVYSLFDIEPVKGKGSYVNTADGTEYLDLYGGHAVISIGHSHPHYVEAVSRQVADLGFYSNSVQNSLQEKLAEKIGRLSGYPDYSIFFCLKIKI